MKLNEEEMYNAHLWLLTIPKVGIVEFASLLIPKEYHNHIFSYKTPSKNASTCDACRKYLRWRTKVLAMALESTFIFLPFWMALGYNGS